MISNRIILIFLLVSFLIVRSEAAQVHWTATDDIQDEITKHSTLIGGVYRLHDGDYTATDAIVTV